MPETQNIRNDNAHEQGIRFLSLLNLMTLRTDRQKSRNFSRKKEILADPIKIGPIRRNRAAKKPGMKEVSFPGCSLTRDQASICMKFL